MPEKNLSARQRASTHIQAALDTGVRGELREALRKAAALAAGERVTDVSDLEYRQLAIGGKLVDKDRPGLLMRHGKRTGKVWIYRFEHPETKKQIELQFGRYPTTGTADAREIWRDLRSQRLEGEVPMVDNSNSPSTLTMGDLIKRYIAEYARVTKAASSSKEDERLLGKFIVPYYEDLPATEFDHEAAKAVLSNIVNSGALREAEKVRSVLSTLFNVASGRTRKISTLDGTWLPPDHPNPVSAVTLPKRNPSQHTPRTQELRNYVRGLDQLKQHGEILRVQLETFARIGEVTSMAWEEIDLDAGTWTLPARRSKNGKAHVVMLARQTVDRLRARQLAATSDLVFPSVQDANRPTDKHLVIRTLARKREAIGVSADFTSHATRRAALTWVAENGGGRDIRDRLSNHTPPSDGADHIYVSAEHNEAARRFTQAWVDHLIALEAENVTPIKEARV
ncbi:tyrosine-type recombinase/integrase [Ruegeria sp. HKCCD7318]|uniref:tyrosine-type recombinase/integrase n=1 Tax=Ruegeria sp. HKCCD7318 TaxID=2683014 RepID=UPI001490C78A|nr:tyrosine-type recombinase/integrase [Ruegeria sp. HKCCD7318]NOE33869.1 tyrosine-type recombinase/integrase [Ruegeria sp. HKCCD7318]